jgi:hypothetical protein
MHRRGADQFCVKGGLVRAARATVDHTVDTDDEGRAEKRHHEPRWLAVSVEPGSLSDVHADDGANDTHGDRGEPAAATTSRDEEAGDGADDEPHEEKDQNMHKGPRMLFRARVVLDT